MNIRLPDKFFYNSDRRSKAYVVKTVDRKILCIEGDINYENLMYSLAYSISGYNRCIYCGKKLNKQTRTLDHKYPRSWGGISIPNNLVPCCRHCNTEKSSMTEKQYREWLTLPHDERADGFSKFMKINEEKLEHTFILPKEWMSTFDSSHVLDRIDFSRIKQSGNERIDLYYKLHGHYPRPIVVSSNNWILKGIHILYHAKIHDIKVIPCVRLDNVIRRKK